MKAKEPETDGVPEMTPVEASIVRPVGSEPELTVKVIGPEPDAVTVCE